MEDSTIDLENPNKQFLLTLQTKDLCYDVEVPDKEARKRCIRCVYRRPTKVRPILRGVDVLCKPGEVTCIMGPSGSGKTTLLDCLSSRIQGKTSGDILINGLPVTSKIMKKVAGYVKQKDILLPSATVKEAIQFSAELRLPADMSKSVRKAKVKELIDRLGLTKCMHTKLGDENTRGVSGGELKRAAIGVELVTDPRILFLDEPTSGLDATSALTIVETLKTLARQDGTTVVCTLHQPRSNIFYLVDRLILVFAGRIIYQGPPKEAINFFNECGHPCPQFTNPPDYFMDVISSFGIDGDSRKTIEYTPNNEEILTTNGQQTSPDTTRKRKKKSKSKAETNGDLVDNTTKEDGTTTVPEPMTANEISDYFISSKRSKKANKTPKMMDNLDTMGMVKRRDKQKTNLITQTWIVMKRAMQNNMRNPMILWAQLSQHLLLSLFIGLMYLRIGKKQNASQDRSAAIFFSLLNATWISGLTAAFVFPSERPLFNRERAGGFYKTLPYYIATTWTDIPLQFMFIIINVTISYWMLWLNPGFDRFIVYLLITFLTLICVQSISLFVSALSPTADFANIVLGLVLLLFMSFGGFFLTVDNTPKYFYPILYTSPFRYAFRAILQNDLKGMTFNCPPTISSCPSGNVTIFYDPGGTNPGATVQGPIDQSVVQCSYLCPFNTGEAILKYNSLEGSSIFKDCMVLLGITAVARICTYLALEFIPIGTS